MWLRPAIKLEGDEYYEYVLMYVDDILAISIDPTEILKSMEGKTVKYKNGKIAPPEMYLGARLKREMINGNMCCTITSDENVIAALQTITFSSRVMVQHRFPLIISLFSLAPGYISGGAILPFLYLTFLPSILFSISVGSIDIARMSSTYKIRYSQYSSVSGFIAGLSHNSVSAGMDLNPFSSHLFAIKDLKSALSDFSPYKALTTITTSSCSSPNFGARSYPMVFRIVC